MEQGKAFTNLTPPILGRNCICYDAVRKHLKERGICLKSGAKVLLFPDMCNRADRKKFHFVKSDLAKWGNSHL